MLLEEGTLTFTIPYFLLDGEPVEKEQAYLNDLDYTPYTAYTPFTGITYYNAIGLSRISELKKYGSNEYSGVTVTDNISGYTIDGIYYRDYPEGYTILTGNTSGYTKEEVINKVVTRNEHFLGFVDDPTIYSDIYIDRGKQTVMEFNLRLGEIENTGILSNYGNGYFKIKKQ